MKGKKTQKSETSLEQILDKLDSITENQMDDDTLESLREAVFGEDIQETFEPLMRAGLLDYLQMIAKRDGKDYEPNVEQMERMNYVIAWCQSFCQTHPDKCQLRHLQIEPKMSYGFAEIKIDDNIHVASEDLSDLKKVLDNCDGFNISGFGTSFLISFYVENLWKKK